MNFKKYLNPQFLVTIILFFIPFFWLKPGEMDLGGDSSRLFFYDPGAYLNAHVLYNVVSSGIGGEAISYYSVPFMLLLSWMKIFFSPTLIISIVNGLKLSMSFLFMSLIVKEILRQEESKISKQLIEVSAVIAGLFYVLSPILVNSGWEKAILAHMQIIFNPLFFFLLLKYFVSQNKKFLIGILLLSFIFSLAFSYAAAPPFFAFYPLSFLFLCVYTKFIRKKKIPIRGLLVGGVVFLLLQGFHLFPHLISIFSLDTEVSGSVFSDETKFSRGLYYFTAIAPNIKIAVSLLGLPQLREMGLLAYFYLLFPFTIFLSFYYNQSRTYLLTGLIFLITLFFTTANITDIGFFFYKSLFYVPGFKMFRNFYGQWAFTYTFFYALLFGLSLVVLLSKIKVKGQLILSFLIVFLLVISSWNLINGEIVNSFHHQSKDVKQVFQMDPEYEKVLDFVNRFSVDGKTLTLPLAGPGYQIIAGKNGKGAYVGPSTFSYLAGKNDYTGYGGLGPFGDLFLNAARDKDYAFFQKIFPLLNIKYVFYNSDEKVYDDYFPKFPYDYAKEFMPNNQAGYKEFIKQLPLNIDEKISFGNKYHLYPVNQDAFSPHIYTTNKRIYTTQPLTLQFNSQFNTYPQKSVFLDLKFSKENDQNIIIEPDIDNPFFLLKNNYHLHRHEPFISVDLESFFYPFVLLREKFDRWLKKKNHDGYVDLSLYHLSKRINELVFWGNKMRLGNADWKEPNLLQFYTSKSSYKSWHASIKRYSAGIEELTQWIKKEKSTYGSYMVDKIKIAEQLHQHKIKLIKTINSNHSNQKKNTYLLSYINKTFDLLFEKLNISNYDTSLFMYKIINPSNVTGLYEVYISNKNNTFKDDINISIEIEGNRLKPIKVDKKNEQIYLGNINLSKNTETSLKLYLPPENLAKNLLWETSGSTISMGTSINLMANNIVLDDQGGFTKEIKGWKSNKQYLISFDYQTFGDDFIFRVNDNQLRDEGGITLGSHTYFERNLSSVVWKTSQSVISSDSKSIKAFLQIIANNNKEKPIIQIKNLSVVELKYPKIALRKISAQVDNTILPKITFTKINPTKYQIDVNNAVNPYSLVFLEAFNKNWKLFTPTDIDNSLQGIIEKNLGNIGRVITSFFATNTPKNKKVIQSYFNGEVNESQHSKTFLEPDTFDSWGKKAIVVDKHYRANGYANSWYITPQDVNGKISYTIILEMSTQRYFYVFLGISFFLAVSLFVYFLINIFKKNEKNK